MKAPTRSINICVVDDELCVRKALGRLLRSAGHKVQTFASAEEFLASQYRPDCSCLVLDIHLEGMNGLQLQQHLLKEGIVIPIVLITADADNEIQTQTGKTGAFLLRKPFQGQELMEAIDLAMSIV